MCLTFGATCSTFFPENIARKHKVEQYGVLKALWRKKKEAGENTRINCIFMWFVNNNKNQSAEKRGASSLLSGLAADHSKIS